jgi:uncharacterized protein YlxW (UPF0749 family)
VIENLRKKLEELFGVKAKLEKENKQLQEKNEKLKEEKEDLGEIVKKYYEEARVRSQINSDYPELLGENKKFEERVNLIKGLNSRLRDKNGILE